MTATAIARKFESKPLYTQVQEAIRDRILTSKYPAGEPLPNEWALSTELGVSIGTLRKAVQALVDGGLILRIPGRGTVVADRQSRAYRAAFDRFRDLAGNPVSWSFELIDVASAAADLDEAEKLQIAPGAAVTRIVRLRLVGGRRVMFERITHPAERIQLPPHPTGEQTNLATVSEANGRAIAIVRKTISFGPAETEAAEALHAAPGQLFMHFDRVVLDSSDEPIEWCRACVDASELTYAVDIQPPPGGFSARKKSPALSA